MFKVTCKNDDCVNKDLVNYIIEPTNPTMCGGCKTDLTPIEMTKKEFDKVFDYDVLATKDVI